MAGRVAPVVAGIVPCGTTTAEQVFAVLRRAASPLWYALLLAGCCASCRLAASDGWWSCALGQLLS